jgi:hypothetical protein
MAGEFELEAEQLGRVSNGLRDVESRLSAAVWTLRGQLGAGGAWWQFPGGPAGVGTNLEHAQSLIDPSMTTAVTGLADYSEDCEHFYRIRRLAG